MLAALDIMREPQTLDNMERKEVLGQGQVDEAGEQQLGVSAAQQQQLRSFPQRPE